MTELFETGSRILAHGRRLFAVTPLAELPAAYASLLRDPGELLEELWGSVEPAEPVSEAERLRPARAGSAVPAAEELPSGSPQWFLNSPVNAAQTPTVVPKAVPLRLSESRPRTGAASATVLPSRGEGYVPSAPQQAIASSPSPLELAPETDAPAVGTVSSDRPAKVVEWPTTRPTAAGSAELATPGNVLQAMDEESGGYPELLRLRGQLEVEEGKRQPQPARPFRVEGAATDASRANVDPSNVPAAAARTTMTSFAPLSQLLTKNIARPEAAVETAAGLAPREPEVIRAADASLTGVSAAESERGAREGAGRGETAPLVEEVLEELYERLRLEFTRTYGTTGG